MREGDWAIGCPITHHNFVMSKAYFSFVYE